MICPMCGKLFLDEKEIFADEFCMECLDNENEFD